MSVVYEATKQQMMTALIVTSGIYNTFALMPLLK